MSQSALSKHFFNISRHSLGNLFKSLTTHMGMKVFLMSNINLLWCTSRPFPLTYHLHGRRDWLPSLYNLLSGMVIIDLLSDGHYQLVIGIIGWWGWTSVPHKTVETMFLDAINKEPEGQNTINVSQHALWKGSLSSQPDLCFWWDNEICDIGNCISLRLF